MSQPVHMNKGNNYSGYNFSNAGNITQLNSASSVSDSDVMLVHNGTNPLKVLASKLKEYIVGSLASLTTTDKSSVVAAINEVRETTMLYKVVLSGVSSLSSCRFPASGTNDKIKSTMEVTESVLSNPAAQTGDWSVNFYDGYLTVTGNISGTTNITLKFQDCITLS